MDDGYGLANAADDNAVWRRPPTFRIKPRYQEVATRDRAAGRLVSVHTFRLKKTPRALAIANLARADALSPDGGHSIAFHSLDVWSETRGSHTAESIFSRTGLERREGGKRRVALAKSSDSQWRATKSVAHASPR